MELILPSQTKTSDQLRENNNWDVVRLVLATIVVAYHSYVMSGLSVPSWYSCIARGDMAVAGFFGLSGYMVAGSYDRAPNLKAYFLSRIARIYPAYAASVIFALIVGLSVTTERNIATLATASGRYLLANLSFINTFQQTIPGSFVNNIHQEINTAWWTLKIEVMFYFSLPILFKILNSRRGIFWAFGLYLAAFAWGSGWNFYSDPQQSNFYARMARQLPGWGGYFVVGALLYLHQAQLIRFRWLIAAASLAILTLGLNSFDLLAPLVVTSLVLSAGLIGPHIPVSRFGDISFGIYIYHAPIIQLLIWLGIAPQLGAIGTFLAVMAILTPLAWLSWVFIEQPAMNWAKAKQRLIRASIAIG